MLNIYPIVIPSLANRSINIGILNLSNLIKSISTFIPQV